MPRLRHTMATLMLEVGPTSGPYVVFFDIEEDRIVLGAVAHTKRRPGYWVARRPPPRTS